LVIKKGGRERPDKQRGLRKPPEKQKGSAGRGRTESGQTLRLRCVKGGGRKNKSSTKNVDAKGPRKGEGVDKGARNKAMRVRGGRAKPLCRKRRKKSKKKSQPPDVRSKKKTPKKGEKEDGEGKNELLGFWLDGRKKGNWGCVGCSGRGDRNTWTSNGKEKRGKTVTDGKKKRGG